MVNPTLKTFLEATACVKEEYLDHSLELVEGALPPELQGTLFRNGNGRFVHQGVTYDHFFDGDGMITRFVFRDGQVHYSNRYVRTREFVDEERRGKMRYRSFGTNIPGGWPANALKMQFKNAANTSVVWHGGQLLALWEGGWPHRIDPDTLETIDRYSYEGVLENDFSWLDKRIMREMPFSAHPKEHPDSGVLYNFGTVAGTKQRLVIYRVEPDGKASIEQAIPMDDLAFTHDFILTASGKKLFCLPPVSFSIWRAFMGLATPVESIRARPDAPMKILIVDGDHVQTFETDFFFIFHYANGYEMEDGTILFDAFAMDDFPGAEANVALMAGDDSATPRARLRRFIVDPKTGSVSHHVLTDYPGELPAIDPALNGKPYRYCWAVAGDPGADHKLLDGIVKYDVQAPETKFVSLTPDLPGEPLFIPHPDRRAEDHGWVAYIKFEVATTATFLEVRDAASLELVAKLRLPHNIPPGFHGCWVKPSL